MWWLGLIAVALGITDAVQSAILQRNQAFVEVGPASILLGKHPRPWQLIASAVVLCTGLLLFTELILVPIGVTPFLVYVPWIVIESWEVWRNRRFLRA